MQIRPAGAEAFHADRWMAGDLMKLTAAFRNFGNAPSQTINILRIYNSGIMLRVN
jgi:hypothetical protein